MLRPSSVFIQGNVTCFVHNWQIVISMFLLFSYRDKAAEYTLGDVFMGYHADTCASIILHVTHNDTDDDIKCIEQEVRVKGL